MMLGKCCCGGCEWFDWDTTDGPSAFYAKVTRSTGGTNWGQTGSGPGNYLSYSTASPGQVVLNSDATTEEYAVVVTTMGFGFGDILRIYLACDHSGSPSIYWVEFRSCSSDGLTPGHVTVHADATHEIDYLYTWNPGDILGACLQKNANGDGYILAAFASVNILLSGTVTASNLTAKSAMLEANASATMLFSNVRGINRFFGGGTSECEDCEAGCGCAEACTVDVVIDGIAKPVETDSGLCDLCTDANGAYTLASMKGAFPGQLICPSAGTALNSYQVFGDSAQHCYWYYLLDHYFWVRLSMWWYPSTGFTKIVGSIHLTDACGGCNVPGEFDSEPCCGPGFPGCAADDIPLCDCANMYFLTNDGESGIYTDGGPQNCAYLMQEPMFQSGSSSERNIGSTGSYNGCCRMGSASMSVSGLSSSNCNGLSYGLAWSCAITATLTWEGIDDDGNATVDWDLYLSDGFGNLCWYDNPTAGPWMLNRDVNCGVTANPATETITGSFSAIPDVTAPITIKAWYNPFQVCTLADAGIVPSVKSIKLLNTGTANLNVNGGVVAPGSTFTATLSGPAPGPGNADTYAAPVLLTIYHP